MSINRCVPPSVVLRTVGLVLALVVISCAGAHGRTVDIFNFHIRDLQLKNGLRVVVEEDHSAPVVGVVAVVGAGAAHDPSGKEGLAHLVEHLTFRAKQAPSRDLLSLLEQSGAGLTDAFTGIDSTVYFEFGARDMLRDFLRLEGLRLTNPLSGLDDKAFEVEREVVRNELRERSEAHGAGAALSALFKATFPAGSRYTRAGSGSQETLTSLTLADARAFVRQFYQPAQMTLLVIGDVDAATVEPLLGETISPPTGPPPYPRMRIPATGDPVPDPPPSAQATSIEGPVLTPEVYVGWSIPSIYYPSGQLAELQVGALRASIEAAKRSDPDILDGSVYLRGGAFASMLICRLVMRDGIDPNASVRRIMEQMNRNWVEDLASGASNLHLVQRLIRMEILSLAEAESVVHRGLERAQFIHFTGSTTLYAQRFSTYERIEQNTLADFQLRYITPERARTVIVRPSPATVRAGAPNSAAAGDASSPVEYDAASIARIAKPLPFASAFQREVLSNGLVVEAARRGSLPIATIGLSLRGGTADQRDDGAALLAMLAADRSYDVAFSFIGGVFKTSARPDAVELWVRAPAVQLEGVLRLLAKIVGMWSVGPKAVENFEKRELPYLRQVQSDPRVVASRAFGKAIFGSHPYGHAADERIDKVPSPDQANRWLKGVLTPAGAVLAIVGDVDPDDAQKAAKQAFGNWKGSAGFVDPPPLPESGAPAVIVTPRSGTAQALVHVGCRLRATNPSGAAGDAVLAAALEGRLRSIRTKLGISYGFATNVDFLRGGTAVLNIEGAVQAEGLASALRTIKSELSGADKWSKADFDWGKWSIATKYDLSLESPGQWVERALSMGRAGFGLETVDEFPALLTSVDRAALAASLRRCATEGVVVIVGDEAAAKAAVAEGWQSSAGGSR